LKLYRDKSEVLETENPSQHKALEIAVDLVSILSSAEALQRPERLLD